MIVVKHSFLFKANLKHTDRFFSLFSSSNKILNQDAVTKTILLARTLKKTSILFNFRGTDFEFNNSLCQFLFFLAAIHD